MRRQRLTIPKRVTELRKRRTGKRLFGLIPDSTADIHDETAKESGFDSKAVIIIVIIAALAGILIPAVILIKKRK